MIAAMKPGVKIYEIYQLGCDFINNKIPAIKNHIPSHFGFGVIIKKIFVL